MRKVKFYVDGCACDLNESLLSENSVSLVCPIISFNNKEYSSDSRWVDTPLDEYLSWAKAGNFFSITQPSVKTWSDVFEEDLKAGYDIFFLSLSQRFSGGYKQVQIARKLLLRKYKDAQFGIMDSTVAGAALKLLSLKIAQLLKEDLYGNFQLLENHIESLLLSNLQNYWVCDNLKNVAYMSRGSDTFNEGEVPEGSPLICTREGTFSVSSVSSTFGESFEKLKKELETQNIKEWEFAYSPDFENYEPYLEELTKCIGRDPVHVATYMGPTNVAIAGLHSFNVGILKSL